MIQNGMNLTCVLTDNCNLRCKYCYIPKQPLVMTEQVIDDTLAFAERDYLSRGTPVSFDIFGGEPLLFPAKVDHMWHGLDALAAKYPALVRATIFTNAILLTTEFLETHKASWFSYNFSIDGNEECHNACRVYPDMVGSYQDVMKGIRRYSEVYRIPMDAITGKFVMSKYNVTLFPQAIKDMYAAGLRHTDMSLARDAGWTDELLAQYETSLKEVAEWYKTVVDTGFWITTFSIPLIDERHHKESSYCSAGKSHLGISPLGEIYPCQRFAGDRLFQFGSVTAGIDKNGQGWKMFQNYGTKNITACNVCDTFKDHNCLGQCLATCAEEFGSPLILDPGVCNLLKITYRVAKQLQTDLAGNPNFEKTLDESRFNGS